MRIIIYWRTGKKSFHSTKYSYFSYTHIQYTLAWFTAIKIYKYCNIENTFFPSFLIFCFVKTTKKNRCIVRNELCSFADYWLMIMIIILPFFFCFLYFITFWGIVLYYSAVNCQEFLWRLYFNSIYVKAWLIQCKK